MGTGGDFGGSGCCGSGGGGMGGDMQPNANEPVRGRHNIIEPAVGAVLQQDQGAEAVPVRLPQKPFA